MYNLFISVWEAIRMMFNAETGRDQTVDQLRKLFVRIRTDLKKV